MSKKRSSRAASAGSPHMLPGFIRGRFSEVMALIDDPRLGVSANLPAPVSEAVMALTYDVGRNVARKLPELQKLNAREWATVYGLLSYCIDQGFALALYRYGDELRAVPEVAGWTQRRRSGGDKGRASQQQAKQSKAGRAKALLHAGMDVPSIADELKCSIATVYRLLKPATGKPQKASRRTRTR